MFEVYSHGDWNAGIEDLIRQAHAPADTASKAPTTADTTPSASPELADSALVLARAVWMASTAIDYARRNDPGADIEEHDAHDMLKIGPGPLTDRTQAALEFRVPSSFRNLRGTLHWFFNAEAINVTVGLFNSAEEMTDTSVRPSQTVITVARPPQDAQGSQESQNPPLTGVRDMDAMPPYEARFQNGNQLSAAHTNSIATIMRVIGVSQIQDIDT